MSAEITKNIGDDADFRQFVADCELYFNMCEFHLSEKNQELPNTDTDNLLERFKKSNFESAKKLT